MSDSGAWLDVRRGADAQRVPLPPAGLTIGRAPGNQLVLEDGLVSRRHAEIRPANGRYTVADLGSSNGTRLNQADLEPKAARPLGEGDVVQIGAFSLTLRLDAASTDPAQTVLTTPLEAPPPPTQAEALPGAFRLAAPRPPQLMVQAGECQFTVSLDRDTLTLGRDPSNDVHLEEPAISRAHARLTRGPDGWTMEDLGSTNGLWLERDRQRFTSRLLAGGDVVRLARTVTVTFQTEPAPEPPAQQALDLRQRERLTFGRSLASDVPLPYPTVSWEHARVVRVRGGGYVVEDLASMNGTYVNGEALAPGQLRQLQPADVIRIGPVKFVVQPEALQAVVEARDLRLDAVHLTHTVGKGRTLLHDLSLSIHPREFVALVGVSGAGKSTLLNALSGFRPAGQGDVRLNGASLYQSFDAFRSELGYVPQADIIHRELSVYQALSYAARLRLPADTTAEERHRRVLDVIDTLLLTERKDVPIHRLSGGQLKRVSIGVELLTEPGLFFLDEATSGLDPGTESQLMRLLRKLADQGHTILLITHATKNVMLCDQVIFLAKGGRLAFYGPPEEALRYFEVKDFDEIYEKVENELSPELWDERFRASPLFRRYVRERLEDRYGPEVMAAPAAPVPAPAAPAPQPAAPRARRAGRRASPLRQFLTLSQRNVSILRRDVASLVLMFLSPWFLGVLNYLTWKQGVFDTNGGDVVQGLTDLFLMALNSVFIGVVASMREIVKESDIYRRERMVVLQLGPYVLSKTWVGVVLALYQAAVFLLIAWLGSGWPDTWQTAAAVFVTTTLAGLAGVFLGLLISAISPNQNVTPLLLLVVIIPQLLFSGGLLPISTFGAIGPFTSRLTATRWSFETLVTISELGKDVAGDVCWRLPEAERDALTEAEKEARCDCMGPNLFRACQFPGLSEFYDPAIDQPEPPQPAEPGPPPTPPEQPAEPTEQTPEALAAYQAALQQFQADLARFQDELEAYQAEADEYKAAVDAWRDEYEAWKEQRGRAIGQAEAVIEKINADYGEMFAVNVWRNWGVLAVMLGVILGAVVVVQKRRDVI